MKHIFAIIAIILVSGCSAQGYQQPSDIYRVSAITYGKIIGLRPVQIEGGWGKGAAIGAGLGYASGSGQSDKNKFARALALGIAGGLVEKTYTTKTVYEYTMRLRGTNTTIQIVSDRSGAMITDCIEIGYDNQGVNRLERVHGDYCINIP